MIVRPFEPWDIGPVLSLVRGVMAAEGHGTDFGGLGIDVQEIGEGERSGNWVAEVDGEIVGVLSIQPIDDGHCEVKRLLVGRIAGGDEVRRTLLARGRAWAKAGTNRTLVAGPLLVPETDDLE